MKSVIYQKPSGSTTHILQCGTTANPNIEESLAANSNIIVSSSSTQVSSNSISFTLPVITFVLNLRLKRLQLATSDVSPIAVYGFGTLNIYIDGPNSIVSNADKQPGIACNSANATLVFYTEPGSTDSVLTVRGCTEGAGIGTAFGNTNPVRCESLIFVDATIKSYGGQRAAGIGAATLSNITRIEIQGGDIFAQGVFGSGIGCGFGDEEDLSSFNGDKTAVGLILISGGKIKAVSAIVAGEGGTGAGIGGGYGAGYPRSSSVYSINITGGYIEAESQGYGAGIGTGYGVRTYSSILTFLSVKNAEIVAKGQYGAGIGAGYGANQESSAIFSISIFNSTITATGNYSAGIGSGVGYGHLFYGDSSYVEHINIQDSNITAVGNYGAGIGTGFGRSYNGSYIATITISGSHINAMSTNGAGIGTGYGAGYSSSRILILNITSCDINATGFNGAGIGTGVGSNVTSSAIRELYISDSIVTARGYYGAGIGAGYGEDGDAAGADKGASRIGSISISGCTIKARGNMSAGIGGGYGAGKYGSHVGSILIKNSNVTAIGNKAAGIGGGYGRAQFSAAVQNSIEIQSGTIIAKGDLASGIGGGNGQENQESAFVTTIVISGGTIIAYGGKHASAIGAGYGINPDLGTSSLLKSAYVVSLTISGGDIEAYGGTEASSIGGGYYGRITTELVITKEIQRLYTFSRSWITIGDGCSGDVQSLTIFGSLFLSTTEDLKDAKFTKDGKTYGFSCKNDVAKPDHGIKYTTLCAFPNLIVPTQTFTASIDFQTIIPFYHFIVLFSHFYVVA